MNILDLTFILLINTLIKLNNGSPVTSDFELQIITPTLKDVKNRDVKADILFLKDALEANSPYLPLQIAHIATMRSGKQRKEASEALKTNYSLDLANIIVHKKLGVLADEHFLDLLQALYLPQGEFFARQLHLAIERKPNENTLTDILCCVDGDVNVKTIRDAYQRLYDTDSMDDIESAVDGPYADLLRDIIARGRRISPDNDYANFAALAYSSHKDVLCTGKYAYWTYFATRSYGEIQQFSKSFANHSKTTFHNFLTEVTLKECTIWSRELSYLGPVDNFKNLLLAIEDYSVDRGKYFFNLLMKGLEKMDLKRITRIIALMADNDLSLGKGAHNSLEEAVMSKFDQYSQQINPWYRDLVQKIIRGNSDPDRDFIWIKFWTDYKKYQ